ncbi:ORF759 protein [Gallid alphaherpesvirus 3]|uniref:ORF759 protein n=1 Tax=Gallid alphaherpesvirus 3 TaxID=35250 RepID=F8TBY7_9ALPH|nr:ORF759 protein [Gallid alphaherpesvirus 3]AEI00198.1 ORF759 protein [Gallid alphaherpesvirus 3]QEY02227.1 ORF759 protein [Gallid alphaherpesvirus 3]
MSSKGDVDHHAGYGVALAIIALLLVHATALIMIFSDVKFRPVSQDLSTQYPSHKHYDDAYSPHMSGVDHGHSDVWTNTVNDPSGGINSNLPGAKSVEKIYPSVEPSTSHDKVSYGNAWGGDINTGSVSPSDDKALPATVEPSTDIVSIAITGSSLNGESSWRISKDGPRRVYTPHQTKRSPPQIDGTRLSTRTAYLSVWDEQEGIFKTFPANAAAFNLLDANQLEKARREVFFVVSVWHGNTNETRIFLSATRLLTRMMSTSLVVYLSWDSRGALGTTTDAAFLARSVNISQFLTAVPPHSQVRCMGHSLGMYTCGSICRQYNSVGTTRCKSILSIDPYGASSPESHVSSADSSNTIRFDADYVAIFATSKWHLNTSDSNADEYIIVDGLNANAVCVDPYEWSVLLCVSNRQRNAVCERFGANNVTTTGDPAEDGSETCMRILPILSVLQSLDKNSAYPLLRMDPPGASAAVPSLPSTWNIYVMGKDYRYSTYGKNESLWYSSAVHMGGPGFFPASVFTVFLPSGIPAVVSNVVQHSSISYGDVAVHSAFLTDRSLYYPRVMVQTSGPILSAYSWRARLHNDSLYLLPLPEQEIMQYKCAVAQGSYACSPTGPILTTVMWRSLLFAGRSSPVPPNGSCLTYIPANTIIRSRSPIEIGPRSIITASFQLSRQLMAMTLENHFTSTNRTLLTFHDVCHDTAMESDIYFEYNWLGASMNITILNPGLYTFRWFFPFEVFVMPVVVTPPKSRADTVTIAPVGL